MTEKQVLRWIKDNLSGFINQALSEARTDNPKLFYTEDWIAGMAYREVGFLIDRYATQGKPPEVIHGLMRGDYSKRPGEKKKVYHGFSYMQIDIDSYPDFITSGKWKDPLECFRMAISVLEEKRIALSKLFNVPTEGYHRAITAAYNCGQGNVSRALRKGKDIDFYTHQKNYSKEVWRFRELYRSLA